LSKTAGIVARTDRKEAVNLASQLAARFEQQGFGVLLETRLGASLDRVDDSTALEDMRTDLIVTVGGDGTILRTCLRIPRPEPPILAVDMGDRGFLTEVPPQKALEAVERYFEGSFHVERCSKLASSVGEARLCDALNEVFVTSRHLAKLLHVRIWKNDVAVADCRADGVIVASPVGSTGYSFSAGGPILDPNLQAFVLTPVCPVTVLRPVVFSAASQVTLELFKPKAATVVIDGDFQREIEETEPFITIKKSEHESSFIRFEGDFYQRLKARLLFAREEGYESE